MIDTHCHIDDPIYQSDIQAFLLEQQQAGVEAILVPGVNAASIEPVQTICRQFPDYLFPAIGLHPEEVKENYQAELDTLYRALEQYPYIAIGEIGLDYHFDTTYKLQQQDALRRQLQWAADRDLPTMIHCRDATEDCLSILREFSTLQGVMHCFSGSNETAKQIVKQGLYLGIGGVITFKNCKLKDNLTDIPLERIVLETDAPYMTPVPFRGQPNQSKYMIYVVEVLAQVYGISEQEIIAATTRNAKALFALDSRLLNPIKIPKNDKKC